MSGNTVYTCSPSTGEALSINGVSQGVPLHHKIFLTVWDGGGIDTYDFSNYATNVDHQSHSGRLVDAVAGATADLDPSTPDHISPGAASPMRMCSGGDLHGYIENAIGGSGNDTIVGNDVSNVLSGGAGNDSLFGGNGNDTQIGGLGNDVLSGGLGRDTFRFDTALNATKNVDAIIDFSCSEDTIVLDNAVFGRLKKEGLLRETLFDVGKRADNSNDFILYNKTSGVLSFDADGSKQAHAPIAFAKLDAQLKLTHDDFIVI